MSGTPIISKNPNTRAREYCLQFLYQCETEKLFFFSESHFNNFINNFQPPAKVASALRCLAQGTLDKLDEIDTILAEGSENWKVSRMTATDRAILRLAIYELLESDTPLKVVLNEAIELAKKFGTDQSGAFVNGILDKLATTLRP